VLGLERASWGYLILMISAFGSLYALYMYEIVTEGALLGLVAAPFALYLSYYVMNNYDRRELALSNWGTIGIHSFCGILMILGIQYW